MKTKLLPFIMVILAFSMVQPLFAANPEMGDTKITGTDGGTLKDVTVNAGTSIKLQARLYMYWHWDDFFPVSPVWRPLSCRYLDFYVYKRNPNGTNGNIFWSSKAIINIFTFNANSGDLKINKIGTYNLVVKYEGNLKHCNSTAIIYVN